MAGQLRQQAHQDGPPTTGDLLTANRRRGRPWGSNLLGAALVVGVGGYLVRDLHGVTTEQQQLLTIVRQWTPAAAVVLAALGVLLLIGPLMFEPRGSAATRILAAAGRGLRGSGSPSGIVPTQLTLTKAKWRRRWRVRRLRSAIIGYHPGQVIEDLTTDLQGALTPFLQGPVRIRWEPDRDRLVISEQPVSPPLLQELHPAVASAETTLRAMLGGDVEINQTKTKVDGTTGQIAHLEAKYPWTTRDMSDSWRERLKFVLDHKAPCSTGYWLVKMDPGSSTLTLDPAAPMPRIADLPLMPLSPQDRMRIPVGVQAGGDTAYWEPAVFPHMLVVGPTGSGKTIFLNSTTDLCIARGWRVDHADPKELSFRGYVPETLQKLGRPVWPGVGMVATTEPECEHLIRDVYYAELRRRYHELKVFSTTEDELQPWLLIVDEAGELVERLNSYHTSEEKYLALIEEAITQGRDPDDVPKLKGTKNPVLAMIWSLLRLGRQAKIFVITATQRPDVNFIPGEARSNLTCRVALGKQDGYSLEMVFNTRAIQQRVHETVVDPVTGQKSFERIRGRATVDLGAGPLAVQTYWTPDPAKAITGELSQQDQELLQRQFEYVCATAAQWDESTPTTALSMAKASPPPEIVEQKHQLIERALAVDLSKPEPPAPQRRDQGPGTPAKTLQAGDEADLEIDGVSVRVEITEIEEDPYFLGEEGELKELQVTYRITSGKCAGEVGVTTLPEDERIVVHDYEN